MDVSIPSVSGKSVSQAKNELVSLGVNVNIMGSGENVISQMPDPTRQIPKGGTGVLYTDNESTETTVTVPNLIGKSVYAVNSELANNNLNLKISGASSGSGEIISKSQSIAEGSQVMPGTVVTVSFIQKDRVE